MADTMVQTIHRDPALFYWILFPITVVMILTGILRHYATTLLATTPKKADLPTLREQRSLLRGINLRSNSAAISRSSFETRKNYLASAYKEGAFLKDPESRGKPAANPMTDPAAMEGMMGMMKGNMAMMIPQTLIMSWINAFFAGFVIMKLPFPLTIRFKSMLQSGVATRDLDVRWVSSLSWYFLNLFGLQSVFIFILGDDNESGSGKPIFGNSANITPTLTAASQMAQQMSQMNPQASGAGMFQPGQDPHKMFQSEAENLEAGCAPGSTTWIILNLMPTSRPGASIQEMLFAAYNSVVAHISTSGDGLVPAGMFHVSNGATGMDLLCLNADNHQITWGMLGAALNALQDFMNSYQIWSAATFAIYDGENQVSVGSLG
ncbi:ER membrane complex subunit 3 [Hypocenomyce scalaris]|nr:ER membrane complex subunit 3 [Hypocenomyce scalaris]